MQTKQWVAEPGQFEILIGSSSKDIKLKKVFDLEQEFWDRFIKIVINQTFMKLLLHRVTQRNTELRKEK